MSKMKKLLLKKMVIVAITLLTINVAANAQEKGDMAVGGNLTLGTGNSLTNFGIGAKFQYNVTNPLRLEGSFTYFLKKDLISMWDLSANGHWLIPLTDNIVVYPLAGLSILGVAVDLGILGGSASDNTFGVNLGGGIEFKLTDKLVLNAEPKYRIGNHWSRFFISAGLAYRF